MSPSTKLTLKALPVTVGLYVFGLWLADWEPQRGREAAWVFIWGLTVVAATWWACAMARVRQDIRYEADQR